MTPYLRNHLGGHWHPEAATQHTLADPVTAEALARTGGAAGELAGGFEFARSQGRSALQAMSYGERAAMLGRVLEVL